MHGFREIAEISAIFSCPKKIQTLEYGRVIHHFKTPDPGIWNTLFFREIFKICDFGDD